MEFSDVVSEISNVYFYTRVSTVSQIKENSIYGIGIEAQSIICAEYFNSKLRHLISKIPEIIQDVGSTYDNQDALVNLDNLLNNLPERSLIIITDVSRLGRNVYQTIKNYEKVEMKRSFIIEANNNKIFALNRADDFHFFHRSLDSEYSSVEKSINTKKRIEIIRRQNGHIGGIPFGKKLVKGRNGVHRLASDPKQQMILRKIISMHRKNTKPKEITSLLANNRSNNYRGVPVKISMVRKIIKEFKRDTNTLNSGIGNISL